MDLPRHKRHKHLQPTKAQNITRPSFKLHQPLKLFYTCQKFVALHIDLVESFIGFPDDIGRQIFSIAVEHNVFKNSPELVKPFCEAYDDLVLSHLNLGGCHLALGQRLEDFTVFLGLEKLDLSRCWLGEDHDVYQHFIQLNRLTHLNLSENNLSDRGLQRMTSQIRMYKDRGPKQLQYLDLSANPNLTVQCTKYLTVFTMLQFLNLSGTAVKPFDDRVLETRLLMSRCGECGPDTWSHQGWAAHVVDTWIHQSRGHRAPARNTVKLDFYKERRLPLTSVTANTNLINTAQSDSRICIYCSLHRRTASRTLNSESRTISRISQTKSRKKPNSSRTAAQPRTKPVSESVLDEDLLSQYLTPGTGSCAKSPRHCDIMGQLQSW